MAHYVWRGEDIDIPLRAGDTVEHCDEGILLEVFPETSDGRICSVCYFNDKGCDAFLCCEDSEFVYLKQIEDPVTGLPV